MPTRPFHRPARILPEPVGDEPVRIAAPPQAPAAQASGMLAWVLVLLPMLSMCGLIGYGLIGHPSAATLVIGVAIVGILLLGAVVNKVVQNHVQNRSRRETAVRYRRHLNEQETTLHAAAMRQRTALDYLHPSLPQLWTVVLERTRIWERRRSDPDFLDVAIGVGAPPLLRPAVFDAGDNPLQIFEAELLDEAKQLVARYQALEGGVETLPLKDYGSVAVVGAPERTRALVRGMLSEAAAFHAADDVELIVYAGGDAGARWEWAKWLPHARGVGADGDVESRLAGDAETFAAMLERAARPRLERVRRASPANDGQTRADVPPHLVIVVDPFSPHGAVGRLPLLAELAARGDELDVTVVSIVEFQVDEPSSVQARVRFDDTGATVEEIRDGRRRIRRISPLQSAEDDSERIARGLAPVRLADRGGAAALARTVRLLDLLHVPSAAAVKPRDAWRPRPMAQLLRTPVGVRTGGEPLVVDLKEAAAGGMGPHGLIVGATGSGKSELLRSLVTGLAVQHDPEVLSFVFADFKGGAAFADLEHLPHVAGMITNLQSDLSRVDRMRESLIGEQARRQRLLRDAGNLDGIAAYQALREQQPSLEPMPYLLIVVDEFAELLAARPEFLDVFIAIGRVGRSLGMHLLFATQRLDEGRIRGLEGHLRYRICLRTFSAAESQAVLGTPDAYTLPSYPGAGYFKVDTTYVQFKTALITAPFAAHADATASAARVGVRRFVGVHGRASAAGERAAADGEDTFTADAAATRTEMEVVIDRLAAAEVAPVHQVWLPPLEATLTLDSVLRLCAARGPAPALMQVPLGMLDRPQEQEQVPFQLDFAGSAGHMAIVGAPQTGKSTALAALMLAFAATHPPEMAQFYVIDLGGGSLAPLEALPHVGAVAGRQDRERMRRVLSVVRGVLDERETLFREHGVGSVAEFRARRATGDLLGTPYGDVFLVIDNWAQLRREFEELDSEIADLLTTGLSYGVHVVVASNRWGDIRSTVKDNISTRLEFRINEPGESEIGRKEAAALPEGVPGRGLAAGGLHFQAALPRLDGEGDTLTLRDGSRAAIAALRARWERHAPAPRVRMLPAVVSPEEVAERNGSPGIPIALDEFRLEAVHVDLVAGEPHFLVFGDTASGKTSLLRTWIRALEERCTPDEAQVVLVDYRRTLLDLASSPLIAFYAANASMAQDAIGKLRAGLQQRLPGADVSWEELVARSWWTGPEYYLVVDDYDLVPAPSGNPLSPITDLLAQGRDVGLHVILARRVGGMSRSAFEPLMQRLRELGTPGVVLNGDPSEGPILGAQKAGAQPPGRGHLVRRNQRPLLVQTVFTPPRAPKG